MAQHGASYQQILDVAIRERPSRICQPTQSHDRLQLLCHRVADTFGTRRPTCGYAVVQLKGRTLMTFMSNRRDFIKTVSAAALAQSAFTGLLAAKKASCRSRSRFPLSAVPRGSGRRFSTLPPSTDSLPSNCAAFRATWTFPQIPSSPRIASLKPKTRFAPPICASPA